MLVLVIIRLWDGVLLYGINAWAGGFLALGVERVRLLLREEEVALGCSGSGAVEK